MGADKSTLKCKRTSGQGVPTETIFTSQSPPSYKQGLALAEGLFLAGRSLAPPNFQAINWKVGQSFPAATDPDRTKLDWLPPEFLSRDPLEQLAKTSVQELNLPGDGSSGSFARVVHRALDEEDCAALIDAVNVKGYTPALVNVGGGVQQLEPGYRNGFRVIVDSEPLSKWLLEVLRPYLPPMWGKKKLVDLNERCRFLCYTPGMFFAEHHDANYSHPSGKVSQVTVQLYLHDVPAEHGGATTFLIRGSKFPLQPSVGSVLLFSQDLLHEGSTLNNGLKYTFRTEAMYM